jgi:predicted nuclease of predicted toxin-antitoxin system
MKFIVDAQLPKRLARWLAAHGHDVLHTLDLAQANRTPDAAIADLALLEGRVVISKDADFVDSHLVRKRPPKLLLVATGNMGNVDLVALWERNLPAIESALRASDFVELGRDRLIVHECTNDETL